MRLLTTLSTLIFVFLMFSTSMSQTEVTGSFFVGYWRFDEGSGATVYDSSGNGNDGTLYGPSWVSGKYGSALSFDGIDDYVEVMDSSILNTSSITVMAWVNIRKLPGYYGGVSMIVAKGTNDRENGHFGLHQYYQGHSPSNPAIFHFYLTEDDVNNVYVVDSMTNVIEGEWYHVAGTYDGFTLRLYVNGVLEDAAAVNVTRTNITENLQIGALRMPGYEYWTNGTIDEVKIFYRALTEEEVLTHMSPWSPIAVSIASPENKTYPVNRVSLTFNVSETASWIGYSLDGQANVTITENATLTDLSDGFHSLVVYAKDTYGYTGASETIYFSIKTVSFPITWIAATMAIVAIAVVGAVYFFKKRKAPIQTVPTASSEGIT